MTKFILTFILFMLLCPFTQAQNVGIGTVNPTEKLHIVGNINAEAAILTGLKIAGNAATGKVLTSDASGNATWQAGVTKISSVWKAPFDAPSRDTSIDGTLTKVYYVSAPEITSGVLASGNISVFMRVGGIGPYQLPYISNAGGRANAVQAFFVAGKIGITRPTFNETAPNNISLPATLEFRYTIIQ